MRVRDHLANVRTLLAWLRTGLTLLALGFVLAELPPAGRLRGGAADPWTHRSGVAAAAAGLSVLVLAARRFRSARAGIEGLSFRPRVGANLALALLAALGGLLAVAALLRA